MVALSSLVAAPLLLHAMAEYDIVPASEWLSRTTPGGEPRNATLATLGLASVGLLSGSLDAIAPIITSCFLLTYLAVNVVVSRKEIVVDGEWVLDLSQDLDENGSTVLTIPEEEKRGQLISKLFDLLLEKAETAKDIGGRAGSDEFGFKGEILLQCDKRLPFSVIREVMFTAGQAQFGNFRFVVIKGSG